MTQDEWKHEQWLKAQEFMDVELCIGWDDTTCNGLESDHDRVKILHDFKPHPNRPKGIINIFQFIGLELLILIASPILVFIGYLYAWADIITPKIDLIIMGVATLVLIIVLNIALFQAYKIKNPLIN